MLGLARPDPKLWSILSHWEYIPEPTRQRMAEEAAQYKVNNAPHDEPANTDKRLGKSK